MDLRLLERQLLPQANGGWKRREASIKMGAEKGLDISSTIGSFNTLQVGSIETVQHHARINCDVRMLPR